MTHDGIEALKAAGMLIQPLAGRHLEEALAIGRRVARRATSAATARINVSALSEADVRGWLEDQLDATEEVIVVYLADGTAVEVRLDIQKIHARDCEDCESEPSARVDIIERELRFEGPLTGEQVDRLGQIANRCPVHRTLTGEIKIRTRVRPA